MDPKLLLVSLRSETVLAFIVDAVDGDPVVVILTSTV